MHQITAMRQIDIIALISSIFVAIVMSVISVRRSANVLRPIGAFFMFFGPAAIFVHMCFHIGQINVSAIDNIAKGTFKYDFRFYSLVLMPAALIYSAALLLQRIKRFLEGERYTVVLGAMVMITLISTPTIPFTPIGSLPILSCIITLCALPFAKSRKKVVVVRKYPRVVKTTARNFEAIEI